MKYLSIAQTAERWGISTRRIQILCGEGRVPGAIRIGSVWGIPEDAEKPADARIKNGKYIAYFQSYTGTYAPVERLRALYTEALADPQVVALSVATRPDCLPPQVLDLLAELNRQKPVFVELGLQTIHRNSAAYIRRGYPLSVFDQAMANLTAIGVNKVVHII